MKNVIVVLVLILFILAGCGGNKQSSDELIMIDVTASYPKKELILQDLLDVEYIALETNDEFVNQGVIMAVGKEIMVIRSTDGFFLFDRNGKGLKKISRRGQGPGEYMYISRLILDEDNNEIFVNDPRVRNIFVYDLDGNFKRSFSYKEKEDVVDLPIHNYDRNNLISSETIRDNSIPNEINTDEARNTQLFSIISKQDGSITKEFEISFKERLSIIARTDGTAGVLFFIAIPFSSITPYQGNWLLMEPSTDTIYRLQPDYSITPFIVRTPPVQSMNPEVFLSPQVFTDRYYIMEAIKKEIVPTPGNISFPRTSLVYDRQEKAIFEYTLYNSDYNEKKEINISIGETSNDEIAFVQKIEAFELVEAYKNGELKDGKLKEIAANLDEESNPVIMLAKYKK